MLYPPKCIFCGGIALCGKNERTPSMYACAACYARTELIERDFFGVTVRALLYDDLVTKAIYGLKYGGRVKTAEAMAEIIFHIQNGSADDILKKADLFAGVPMHKKKEAERGFNQADLIAEKLAALYQKPFAANIVQRTVDTKPQAGLNPEERAENVKDVFFVPDESVFAGGTVALCDDILTTGATMRECGDAIAGAGAVRVIPVVFAMTR